MGEGDGGDEEVRDTSSPFAGEGRGEGYPKDSQTTEVYTRVSTPSIGKIKSSLDSLKLEEGGDK